MQWIIDLDTTLKRSKKGGIRKNRHLTKIRGIKNHKILQGGGGGGEKI